MNTIRLETFCIILFEIFILKSLCVKTSARIDKGGEITINRHFKGDIFITSECSKSFCVLNGTGEIIRPGKDCECQCKTSHPIFREDTRQCVKDFPDCMLADFVSGSASEKIPFVFMPHPGQLIYPSAEIAISNVDQDGSPVLAPICVVSSVDILEINGWKSFDNITGDAFQQPFQLHRDDDKTYLQWLGDDRLRKLLEGRLVLVHLLCKDTVRRPGRQLFSPCVAFRVAGSPGTDLLSSVYLRGESLHRNTSSSTKSSEGLSFGDYLAIGVCIAFLGVVYIVAIIFFIILKRKKRRKDRLRRQFLQPPSTMPPGLGYKSSRILGLEEAFIPELRRDGYVPTSLGSTRVGEPVYDITKKSKNDGRNHPSDSEESIVLQKNEKLFEAASMQVGKSNKKPYTDLDDADKILVNSAIDKDSNEQGQASMELFSKIRCLVNSARAKMKSYSPNLTDIPEEIPNPTVEKPSTYNNPAFVDEGDNFVLNRPKKGSSKTGGSFKNFNDVNAKLYESFRKNNGKHTRCSESSDLSSADDSLEKRPPRENSDPLSLDSGVITNGSVSPTSTTNDHNHAEQGIIGSSNRSSPNQENLSCKEERILEETDDEVVDVASDDTDSSDNDGYFDSLKRQNEYESHIVETFSPQFKGNTTYRKSLLSPTSSIAKPKSIVPNYVQVPPRDMSDTKTHEETSSDILTKLYDKAVLKIPKVIPSDNESLYSERSNTIKTESCEHDSLDPIYIKRGRSLNINRKMVEDDSSYEIVEYPGEKLGLYVNDMFSSDTLGTDRRKNASSLVGEKMILSVSAAPSKEKIFSNKLLIAVENNVNVSQTENDKVFDPDTLERGGLESLKSFNSSCNDKIRDSVKIKSQNLVHKTSILNENVSTDTLPPSLPPKKHNNNRSSLKEPLPSPSRFIPPPPPLPPSMSSTTEGRTPSLKKPSTVKKSYPPPVPVKAEVKEEEFDENMSFQERRERLENSFKARGPASSVLKRIQDTEKGEYCGKVPSDGVSKGMEIALNIRSRVAQESSNSKIHSKNQTNSNNINKDSFKSSWRKTVEFVGGGTKEESSSRISKFRPEDSGYMSTDSSELKNRLAKISSTEGSLSGSEGSSTLSSSDDNESSSKCSTLDTYESSILDLSKARCLSDENSVVPISYRKLQNSDIRTYKL